MQNNFFGSIDTDAAIGNILSNFDSAYIIHSIENSLSMKFRPFEDPMPNFVDILERQFNLILEGSPDYRDQITLTRSQTYKEVIEIICRYYNLQFNAAYETLDPMEQYGIARSMYDIFVARFTNYMIDFFIYYIINNSDSIYQYLIHDDNIKKYKDRDPNTRIYIDPKFALIHQNLNTVILNMTSYDVSLEQLLFSFVDAKAATRLNELLTDGGDIYKNHYAIYITDQRYMASVLTVIKLKLQSRTKQIANINTNTDIKGE